MAVYLNYLLENTEPLRIADDSTSQMGQTLSLDYIPGSTIRGFVINKLAGSVKLSEIKKRLVEKDTLANCIDELGLAEYLIMGKGDWKNNVQDSPSVKEDLFEAILGAIAVDSDFDLKKLQDSVEFMLNPKALIYEDELNYYRDRHKMSM